jgi:PucR family transcriptional regulator, purine catabolism regulatory protein
VIAVLDQGDAEASRRSANSTDTQELVVLRRLVTVYRQLSSIAAQDADLRAVVDLIAVRTESAVAIVDRDLNVVASSEPAASARPAVAFQEYLTDPRLVQVFEAAGRSRCALVLPESSSTAAAIVAPVVVGDDVPAYVLTADTGARGIDEDGRLLLTEHAATVCGVILGRDQIMAAAASRARDDLVEGLLYARAADADETDRWAKHVGYDSDEPHRVLSMAVVAGADAAPAGRAERASAALERMLGLQPPVVIAAVRGTEVVVVLRQAADGASSLDATKRLGEWCIQRLHESFPDVSLTIGVGPVCRAATEIAQSYADARRAVEVTRRMGRTGQVAAFEELGIHRLLLESADISALRDFAVATFGDLVHRRADYLSTLACYFRENSSPQRAARRLHVHANTVTYRVRRIEQLTGLDFGNYSDRLVAQVALEILDAVGPEESEVEREAAGL